MESGPHLPVLFRFNLLQQARRSEANSKKPGKA